MFITPEDRFQTLINIKFCATILKFTAKCYFYPFIFKTVLFVVSNSCNAKQPINKAESRAGK